MARKSLGHKQALYLLKTAEVYLYGAEKAIADGWWKGVGEDWTEELRSTRKRILRELHEQEG